MLKLRTGLAVIDTELEPNCEGFENHPLSSINLTAETEEELRIKYTSLFNSLMDAVYSRGIYFDSNKKIEVKKTHPLTNIFK